ncbi:MAG: hypothetical protein CL927_00060 [Deltaproteobacteria bacterium]|nr:hypothetical protein [Deltaproteobacteria bacterium]HCH66501.1 hypothetical protein [Deltaproteobacteria bacterium]
MRSPNSTIRRLFKRFLPHRYTLAGALVLVALHSTIPGLLVLLVEVVLDDVLVEKNTAALQWIPWAVVGLYAANGALGFARGMLTRSIAWRVLTDLRQDVFAALMEQDPAWHRQRSVGTLTSRLVTDVDNIQYGVSAIVTAVQKPLTLIVLLLAAMRMSPTLTAVALVAVPVVVLPIRWLGHRLRERARVGLDARADLSAYATETWNTLTGVQAASAEPARMVGFQTHNEALRAAAMRSFAARLLPSPVVETAAAIGVACVVVVGGEQVMQGQLLPGELVAFLLAVGLLNDPLKGLAEVHTLAQRAAAGASTAFDLIDRTPAIVDGPEGALSMAPSAPMLELDNVTIDYGEGPILEGFSLTVRRGEIVALAGASGAGKTSLVRLVPRLMDPTSGCVRLGGADVSRHSVRSVRRQVAWVGQEPVLLNATIAENIALARANASRAEVVQAARSAGAEGFIHDLPNGFETAVGEGGSRLSGGQRQRIHIARAFLQNAPVVVLDEPTSALDADHESIIQSALDRLCSGRAVLLVSHRKTTLARAHRVVHLHPAPSDKPRVGIQPVTKPPKLG